jgi:CubicO group peptidase (beta-lactamase class C family)
MKKLLTTACLFVVTTVASVSFIAPGLLAQEAGQPAKTGQAREATLDSGLTSRVDKLFEKWDKPDSPGCALGIVRDGRLIYKRGYGMANLDHNVPISPKTVFNINSMDKQFTAMSILLLERQGKLSLDDEIQKFVPEFPRYQSPITIRHLIHHTSGIREVVQLAALAAGMWTEGPHLTTDDDRLRLIERQKGLSFQPGEEYLYSNAGYFLLDLIVKKVSGKSQREFAEENIFKPLGMNNTHIHVIRSLVVKNRATGYSPPPGSKVGSVAIVNRDDLDTIVEDLFLWDQNFHNNKLGGGPDLITEELSTGKLNNGENTGYAFGLFVGEYKGLKRIGHSGGGDGFESEMIRFPEQNFSVMCLCNAGGIGPSLFNNPVVDIFLADQFKKGPGSVSETAAAAPDIISVPEKELASLTGLYVDPLTSYNHRIYMKDGKLMFYSFVLSPLSRNRFKVVGAQQPHEFVFMQLIAGGPMQMKDKNIGSGKTTTYYAVQSETLTSAQLAEFTGEYISDELAGATYTLSVKDGKLSIRGERGQVLAFSQSSGRAAPEDFLLTPVFADVFLNPGGDSFIIKFTRNQQNAVSGFTLNASRLRGLRFDRVKR